MQSIIRVQKDKDNPFVMMDKRPIENAALSWKAKGILAYLLSRPDDWVINMTDLQRRSIDGESSVRSGVKELESAGYITRAVERDDHGKITKHIFTVFEKPERDFPQMDNPQMDNHVNTNTDSTKKNYTNTSTTGEIFAAYQANFGALTPMIRDSVGEAIDTRPHEWILKAMNIAVKNSVRKWSYVESILDRWHVEGEDNGKQKPYSTRNPSGYPVNDLAGIEAALAEMQA